MRKSSKTKETRVGTGFVWPRQHAANIIKLKTKEERKEYIESKVPPELQGWVRSYVEQWWQLNRKERKNERIKEKSIR